MSLSNPHPLMRYVTPLYRSCRVQWRSWQGNSWQAKLLGEESREDKDDDEQGAGKSRSRTSRLCGEEKPGGGNLSD
eukprot:273556-Hanusia_phi.AAC.2